MKFAPLASHFNSAMHCGSIVLKVSFDVDVIASVRLVGWITATVAQMMGWKARNESIGGIFLTPLLLRKW